MQQFELKHLGRLIANCWSRAEDEVKSLIAEKYHGPAEENITFLLAGELRKELVTASRDGKVARAFLDDLQSIGGVRSEDVRNFDGLMARVVFHRRTHESRRSASDLGVIINQPRLRFLSPREIVVERDCRRGLLAQAKLFRAEEDHRRKQSRLTKSQERLIPGRMSYYALLAYRVERQSGNLDSLAWQVCRKEHTLKDVKAWLREHTFPNEERTYDVIRRLAAGRIGTDNPAVVNEIVDDASTTRVIEVHLHWPEDRRPPPQVIHVRRSSVAQRVVQPVRR
jgi:hypothetical protein